MADVFRGLAHAFGEMDRAAIRRSLHAALGGDTLDLSKRPHVEGWFISISHTDTHGGWVAARTPIGFDVESVARLRPELIARISTTEERAAAPDPRWLWPAKEAAYKAMSPQPATLPEVDVTSWDGLEFTTAFGRGWVAVEGDLVIAIFTLARERSGSTTG